MQSTYEQHHATVVSIEKQARQLKIEQDCQLIEVTRAGKQHAFLARCLRRHEEAHEPLAGSHPAIDMSAHYYATSTKAVREAMAMGIDPDRINHAHEEGTFAGQMDVTTMTDVEITNTIQMYEG